MRRACLHLDANGGVCGAPAVRPECCYEFWCEKHRPLWLDNLLEQFRWQLHLEEAVRERERPRCAKCLVAVPEGMLLCAAHTKRPASSVADDRDSATDDQFEPTKRKPKGAPSSKPAAPPPTELPQTLASPAPVRLHPCSNVQCRSRAMVFHSGTMCDDCNKAWPRGGLDITRTGAPPTLGASARTQSASAVGK